ncbi:enoyl-CoA hydratase/isomerase family protein [Gulosibacter hominis]|uniref:enoyl-CoA hydratase/isomerase family protein n=1 Tax=Gulosibacter hominis TaxID=2770504 RepID=UPI00191958F4|nr:enoyl-CoA hydratase/isomerase family protein [Gulosibacter hominis]
MNEHIAVSQQGAITIITLQRPDALNAMNSAMLAEIDAALTEAEADPNIRALLFIGSGRAFAAGADVTELSELSHEQMLEHPMPRLYARIRNSPLATLAAVHGFALGGGFELALACDLRIAGTSAEFGLPELSLGIVPGAGGTQMLCRSVGESRALHLILTGARIRAHEAQQWGIVSAIYPDDELTEAAIATLERVLRHSASAVATAKTLVRQALSDSAAGHDAELTLQAKLQQTPDAQEGMQAFVARRKPNFSHQLANWQHQPTIP